MTITDVAPPAGAPPTRTKGQDVPLTLHIRPGRYRGTRASWVLLPDPATVPKIRRRVRRRLADWGVGEHSDVVELLVSEVVTNAMRHSWGAIMTISVDDGALRCEVQDTNPAMPQVCHAHDGDESGRGMYLMEALSNSWGSYRVPAGKVVWFEIARADTAASTAA
jgi:anti-sigma regulatory factor (Ser/Thr protein kinase)